MRSRELRKVQDNMIAMPPTPTSSTYYAKTAGDTAAGTATDNYYTATTNSDIIDNTDTDRDFRAVVQSLRHFTTVYDAEKVAKELAKVAKAANRRDVAPKIDPPPFRGFPRKPKPKRLRGAPMFSRIARKKKRRKAAT